MKFLILHGSFGSKEGNWFPALQEALVLLNQEVILEQFPVDDYEELEKLGYEGKAEAQTLDNWLTYFEDNILEKLDEPFVIVAHSLAPVFALHFLENFELNADSSIFVAPFLGLEKGDDFIPTHIVNASFYREDFDFEDLKIRVGDSYVVNSDNDPYVPQSVSQEFASKLDSSVIMIRGGQHLSASTGSSGFPLVLELCKSRVA